MPKYVRARGNLILKDDDGVLHTPQAGEMFEASSPLVKSHPGAFMSEEEAFTEQEAGRFIPPTEVEVEQATAAPGERRGAKRK